MRERERERERERSCQKGRAFDLEKEANAEQRGSLPSISCTCLEKMFSRSYVCYYSFIFICCKIAIKTNEEKEINCGLLESLSLACAERFSHS